MPRARRPFGRMRPRVRHGLPDAGIIERGVHAGRYLVCAEGPPFLANGPMDKTLSFIGHSDGHPTERCHFGRAVESLAVTQSTLSRGIKELEARLGVTLFERSHRHLILMPLGKEIATRAQPLMVDAEELVGLARNAQEPLSGPLRFGLIPTVGPYVLPSPLSRLGTALPKLKLYVREAQTVCLRCQSVDTDSTPEGVVRMTASPIVSSRRYDAPSLPEVR